MKNRNTISSGFVWLPVLLGMLAVALLGGIAVFGIGQHNQINPQPWQVPTSTVVSNSQSATFLASPTSGPAPLTVQFSQSFIEDWREAILFGDETTCGGSAGSCATHTYNAPGTYIAKLYSLTGTDGTTRPPHGQVTITVTSSNGDQASVTGMSKYADADFGFSFWYPSEWSCGMNSTRYLLCKVDGKTVFDFYPAAAADGGYSGEYWAVEREEKVGIATKQIIKNTNSGEAVVHYQYSVKGEIYWSTAYFIGVWGGKTYFGSQADAEATGDRIIKSITTAGQ